MESTVLLLPFILSSLVTTTFSLSCTECTVEGSKPCQGPAVTCLPGFDSCVATLEIDSTGGKEVTWYKQYCGKTSMCSYTGTQTTYEGGRKVGANCCFTNSCVPPTPKLPTIKPEKNGLSCKVCSHETETACKTVECTGEENKCVSITSTIKAGKTSSTTSVSGCGTPGWCDKDREFQYGAQTTEITFTCSSGKDPLAPALLLLAALLLMKAIS
ncbi:hypothetical protein GDO78_021469 [Eleutherodactylus coqui]|uniref:UPAR/Ly6 domain-containing protein n=1 Tax=Eleutherodactylus coqui TaxID=57060 RepID=A0A8J6JSG5_ELECQ|nr:hypothetical protein GDO78_021469 [Eleutherodactylus coqui]